MNVFYCAAWETKDVKIEALNDSKNIGMCIYNVFIMSGVSLLVSMVLGDYEVSTTYLTVSICILISTVGTLLIVFTPKVSCEASFRCNSLQMAILYIWPSKTLNGFRVVCV